MPLFPHLRRGATAILLSAALALPAAAQDGDPRPGLAEVLDPNLFANIIAVAGISALRTQMEVSYEHLDTDLLRGTMSLSGVTLRPWLDYDRGRQCVISVDRMTVSGNPVGIVVDISSASVSAIGVEASLACLPQEPGLILRQAGLTSIAVDRVGIDAEYMVRTGDLALDVTLGLNGVGIADLSAAGTLLPRPGPGGMDGDPAIRLTRAVVSIANRGGWEAAAPLIPEGLRDPEALRMITIQAMSDLFSEGGQTALSAAEVNFIDDLAGEVARFAADPGELTLEAQLPAAGLVVEPVAFDKPSRLVALLGIDARAAPSARSALVDTALLARIGDDDLDDAESMALATALLSGEGVPRAPGRAIDVLEPLIAAGDGVARLMAARALADRDPAAAYAMALEAAGAPGLVSLLDGLETQMTTGDVLAAQSATDLDSESAASALPDGGDPRDLRREAVAYFTGNGAPRNYANAYLMALLATAAGDIGAPQLLSEIEGRFVARGEAVTDLWRSRAAEIEALALDLWIDAGLAERYAAAP